uniref:Poly(3-hydroxybutyrate) depolymerase A n=1 Tax=Paucimonas lemoignei TaxID=29443 RepID=Q51871_PAULE|nr:poly(3-hydroxybutyrate) depolymerase A precursor [Paucimonas lemoignei]
MRNTLKAAFKLGVISAALLAPFATQAATAGPGAWSSQQTWAADSVNGGNLTGFYYWPATQPVHANGKRALVLVLHGCAQTASGDVINNGDNGYNWKAAADQYGAVILAPNATGNVSSQHCWDYSRTSHSRSTGHEYVLLDLINRFKNDPQYEIDPNQVYVTGLSSGGGETIVLGCIAPDVFAGWASNAGPTPGTTTLQIGAVPSGYTATNAKNNCLSLAGSNSSYFSTQIAGVVWGTSDFTVAPGYNPLMMDAMRQIYGGTFTKQASTSVATGGTNTTYKDSSGRVRTHELSVSGMSHAWPAGTGGQNTNYVTSQYVNYPLFVMDYFFTNNSRAGSGGGTTTTTAGGTTTTTAAGTTTTAATTTTTASSTTTTVAATCYTSSNYAHVTAGRAHNSSGYALANGSNQNMGLNNTFYTSTLKQTSPGYYVIGTCP